MILIVLWRPRNPPADTEKNESESLEEVLLRHIQNHLSYTSVTKRTELYLSSGQECSHLALYLPVLPRPVVTGLLSTSIWMFPLLYHLAVPDVTHMRILLGIIRDLKWNTRFPAPFHRGQDARRADAYKKLFDYT